MKGMEKTILVLHLISLIWFAEGTSRPNIIIIMADDLGWNDVGFHGSDQIPTPNIDALAYNGIILNRHYTLPTCTPSRAAFLTGKYPIRTGMQGRPLKCGEPRGLPLEEITLPQRLQDLGYVTRLIGKWHLGYKRSEYTPTKRGFDSYFGHWNGYIGYFDYLIDDGDYMGYDLHRGLNASWAENGQYATDVYTREAIHLISTHDTSRPLFLEVAHLAVHSGRDSKLLEVPNTDEALDKFSYITDTQRRIYAEMTTRLDDSVGQIVTALLDKGILNNTIILFLTDNGAQTIGEHKNWGSNWPYRGLKFTLYEGGVRGVAALWSTSLRNPGRVVSHLIHISDWYPTIYSMAGGDVSALGVRDGINQWPSLLEDRTSNNDGFPRNGTLLNIGDIDDWEAIIDGKWKLIRSTNRNGIYDGYYGEDGRRSSNPSYNITRIIDSPVSKAIASVIKSNLTSENKEAENQIKQLRIEATVLCKETQRYHKGGSYCPSYCLFDLENDPCEAENLISKYPNIAESLKNQIERFRREMVPELTKPVSPESNPAYFNNTWACWLDDENLKLVLKLEISRNEAHKASGSSINYFSVSAFLLFIFTLLNETFL